MFWPCSHKVDLWAWRAFLRTCVQGSAWLTLLASLEFGEPANAESPDRWRPYQIPDSWRPHQDVGVLENVALRIHWFGSTAELREAAKNSGQAIKEIGLKGFSILKHNTKTGEFVCDLYVVKMTGERIDGDHTTTFGHEVLHCFGLQHE